MISIRSVLLLIILIYVLKESNPKLDTLSVYYPRLMAYNLHLFTLALVPHLFYSNKVFIGILGKWFDISSMNYLVPAMDKFIQTVHCTCMNGICFFKSCFCLMGWDGITCNIKRRGFISIWDMIYPLLHKAFAYGSSSHLILKYNVTECILGIPTSLLPKSITRLTPSVLINFSLKCTVLDLILAGMCLGFALVQFQCRWIVLPHPRYGLDLHTLQLKHMLASVYMIFNWIEFVNIVIGFYKTAPIIAENLGYIQFGLYYIITIILISSFRVLLSRYSITFRNYGSMELITSLKFGAYFMMKLPKSALSTILLPHFITVHVTEGYIDVVGIIIAYAAAICAHVLVK
jgi:hypothetical protein